MKFVNASNTKNNDVEDDNNKIIIGLMINLRT